MARYYPPMNVRNIEVQFKETAEKLKGGMHEVIKNTAKQFLMNVIMHEPAPFKTGSYISSHRVGINTPDSSDTIIKKKGVRTLEQARGRALSELRKIDTAKPGDTIIISNSVGFSTKYGYSWARNVEYMGWNGKGPYLVYESALSKIPKEVKEHVREVRGGLEPYGNL